MAKRVTKVSALMDDRYYLAKEKRQEVSATTETMEKVY